MDAVATDEPARRAPGALADALKNEAWMRKQFSDITVTVREERFELHRLVVCESPLFRDLFLGEWKDVARRSFSLAVDDPNVTSETFRAVVGTMYGRELRLTAENARGVYATTSLLRMSGLSLRCVEYIVSHVTLENATAWLHFATARRYLHAHTLVDGVSRYCMRHVAELRRQLADVPLQVLREMLKSDELSVASEAERFRLASDVFAEKMDASWTHLEVGDGLESGDGERWVEVEGDECREHPSGACSNTGAELAPRRSFDFEFRNEELAEIQTVFRNVLCSGVRYEHLSDEDALEVWTRIQELGVPGVAQAFERGMLSARLLRMTVRGVYSESTGRTASSALLEHGVSAFRFGCELRDVRSMAARGEWQSGKRFYAGSDWWLGVDGKIDGDGECPCLNVRVCCESAGGPSREYENGLTPHVWATVMCGATTVTINKDGADWLARFDFALPAGDVRGCMTPAGSIRFVVLIRLVVKESGL